MILQFEQFQHICHDCEFTNKLQVLSMLRLFAIKPANFAKKSAPLFTSQNSSRSNLKFSNPFFDAPLNFLWYCDTVFAERLCMRGNCLIFSVFWMTYINFQILSKSKSGFNFYLTFTLRYFRWSYNLATIFYFSVRCVKTQHKLNCMQKE